MNKRHFVLYAKGWYERKNRIDDLKRILSVYSGIEEKYISNGDIISVLLNLTFDFPSIKDKCKDFIIGLAPCNRWKFGRPMDDKGFEETLIDSCISYIALTTKEECDMVLGELGKPDKNVLPLTRR